jgi:para-nitrobenzyl esterase
MERRTVLGLGSLIGLASAGGWTSVAQAASKPASPPRPSRGGSIISTPKNAIVETKYGKVRGYVDNGIFVYKGVRYAASTAGAARFTPPQPPKPWAGVEQTMSFGPNCPQVDYARGPEEAPGLIRASENGFNYESEDCLRLNVWTPGVMDGRRRPVLVWLHGGAFLNGTANRVSTHGCNLAVSVNHRLNVLGHLDLSSFGSQYQDSANAGALDMVAALQWVRDNIQAFGGDPGCVTIYGQSGGGAKCAALMAMPAARGLFHRAAVMSSSSRISDAVQAERLSAAFLKKLDIDKSSLSRLQSIPVQELVRVGAEVSAAPLNPGDDWRPKVDGRVVLQQPFLPGAPALSADVPVLIGGTRHEFAPDPADGEMTEAALMENLVKRFGAQPAAKLRSFFARTYPGISTNEVMALINVQPYRVNHANNAGRRAALGRNNTYYYIFAWKPHNLDGLPLAYHGVERPFVFHNVAECAAVTGGTDEAYDLADRVSDAWLAFARTGNPNHPGIPKWDSYNPAIGNTMVFDTQCTVMNDPWKEDRLAVTAAAAGKMIDKPSSADLGRS